MRALRVGVIGCGAIAQVQHLPHLRDLDDQFAIGAICDRSRELLKVVGDAYHVPPARRFTDARELLTSDLDAALICHAGAHAPVAIAAAQAGKHVLVEKPACSTVREAEAMVAAAELASVVLMIAYPKRHDPAYQYAQARVASMDDVRFIQVNHLHPDNALHTAEFRIHVPRDLGADERARWRAEEDALVREALGRSTVPPPMATAFALVNGSLIHDLGNLHGMFGPPARVVSTEIWHEGRALTTVLAYASGARAVVSWVDLPDLWHFHETLEVYGRRERVLIAFPTGFSRGLPTQVTVEEIEGAGRPVAKHLSWHENPFKNELAHFGACIREGKTPLTPGREVVDDVALVRDIVLAYARKEP